MNDLLYTVGIDPTDLNRGAAMAEERMARSAANIQMVNAKSAEASAAVFVKTFEQEFAGEQKLAAYRAEIAFKRLTDEEKLAVLRLQAHGLMEQIGMAEGDSVRKLALQLEFEQKKSAIFDLNQKLTREQSVILGEQTTKHKEHEGLLGAVEGWGQKIKKGFHEMGITLHGAGIGIVLAEVVSLTKEAIVAAQKQRDEYEKLGKPLDSATRSMANLGDAVENLKHAFMVAASSVVSGWAQIGDLLGSAVNRMRGISEAQENAAAQGERAAKAAEERVKKLKEEQHDVEKIAAARKDLAEAAKKEAFDRADDETKLKLLIQENLNIRAQINNTEKGTVLWFERQKQLIENSVELRKLDYDLVKQRAEQELGRIQQVASLDLTYQQKRATLEKESAVLQRELASLQKGTADYKKVENDLREKGIELVKLDRDWRKSASLEAAAMLELARLEYKSRTGLTEQEQRRLQLLRAQAAEKENQFKIDELIEKKIVAGLTPAETARLNELFKQEVKIERQLKLKQELYDATLKQVSAEELVARAQEEQERAQQRLNKQIEEATQKMRAYTAMFTGLHQLENLSGDVLNAKRQKLQDEFDTYRQNWRPNVGVPFIQGDETYNILLSQLNSIDRERSRRDLLTTANARGGRQGTLAAYVGAGYDPLSFDTVYSQLDNWTRGQSETNQQLGRVTNGIAAISNQLGTILGK